ncbi:MAG TPA: glycoside hydrolase domain-containing protein [Mycobacteriales bacterium]|nr:glycoside hydrolase domain-containing protein [Mycobacteriales bacterium]
MLRGGLGRLTPRRARPAVAAAVALLASGAVAVAPHAGAASIPGPTVSLAHAIAIGEGFDICQAPPTSTMRAWLKSPMRSVNIYFAGAERACSDQPYLSAEWVRTVTANGWSLIPTDVDRQPPCYSGTKAKISRTPSVALQQGKDAADTAIDSTPTGLRALGIPRHSPAYIDIENFPAGHPTCDTAVRQFMLGWINELRARGYRAGVYGLPTGAIRVLVAAHKANSSYPIPDAIWFARYDGVDSTASADIPSTYLPYHRIHQYLAGVDRTYGGIKLNIDKDAMHGDVVRMSALATPPGPPYAYAAIGSPGTTSTTPGSINLRAAPSSQSMQIGSVRDGDAINIECQAAGETINGDYVWDKIDNPAYDPLNPLSPQYVYISDLYTNTTGGDGVSTAIQHCEYTPPTVTVTSLPLTTLHSSVTFSYSASDESGIAAYDVRWMAATDRSGFGAWHYPSTWQRTRAKSETLTGLAPGGTYCLSVRAYDRLTNRSKWSPATCIARALDDRAMTADSRWKRRTSSGYYMSTYTSTQIYRAAMSRTNEQVYRIGIVATRCVSCGKVRILVGGQSVGVIDLTASTVQRRRTLLLPAFTSLRKGTVTIRVISSGKTVQIDGLVISRR